MDNFQSDFISPRFQSEAGREPSPKGGYTVGTVDKVVSFSFQKVVSIYISFASYKNFIFISFKILHKI